MSERYLLFLCSAAVAWAAETAVLAPKEVCRQGGFSIIRMGGRTEVIGKADSGFKVSFDASSYKNNGFDESLRSAMNSWNQVAGSNLRFSFEGYTDDASDQDGRLSIVKGGLTLPPGVLAATLVSASISSGQIVDSDIFFNPGDPINTPPSKQEYDFELIALHELGHALGLDHNDECTATPTVMYPTLTPGEKGHSLLGPELDGVKYLYSGGKPGAGASASPLALYFTGPLDGPPPATQTIALSGVSGMTWSAAAQSPWITISPDAGTLPATLTVQVTPQGLSTGYKFGSVAVAAGGLALQLGVSLNVTTLPPPLFQVTPSSLSFAAVAGGPQPAPQQLNLLGGRGLAFSAVERTGATWLRLSPANGTLPGALSVAASTAGLAPGIYTGAVTVAAGALTQETAVQLELAAQPRLLADVTQVSLTSQAGRVVETCAPVRLRGFADTSLNWSASADAPWIILAPASGTAPGVLNICATSGSLVANRYAATVTVSAPGASSPLNIGVAFSVTPTVSVSSGGVVNAATFSADQPVSAGELITIFGSGLASQTARASGFPLPTALAGSRVLVGGMPAPLVFVSPEQINLIAPSIIRELAGSSTVINVYSGSLAAPGVRVRVADRTPGVFTVLGNGAGAGAITHADGSLVSRSAPLAPGEVISLYLTGIGPLNPPVADGAPAPAAPLARAVGGVRLRFDGKDAEVIFAGASPGFAGLHVVVATVPSPLPRRFPEVVVEVEGVSSNRTTAGGPSLLDVSPASIPVGAGAKVTLRGVNLPGFIRVGGELLSGTLTRRELDTLEVSIPARLLATAGTVMLTAVDPDAPVEPPSNPVFLNVQ